VDRSELHRPRIVTGPAVVGLVGFGRWGKVIAQALEHHQLFHLAAIATRITDHGLIHSESTKIYTSSNQMLRSEKLDGLIIANSPDEHYGVALIAINMGLATWIEKPMTLNPEQSDLLLETGRRLNARVLVDHVFVHSPAWKIFKQASSKLGRILSIETSGGGPLPIRDAITPLWDWGPHDTALVLDLVQTRLEKVKANIVETIGDQQRHNVRLELQFSDGIKSTSIFGTAFPKRTRKISVVQEHGIIDLDDFDRGTIKIHHNNSSKNTGYEEIPIPLLPRPLDAALNDFRAMIISQREAISDLSLGNQVVQVLALAELDIRNSKNE